ncbi:MAG: hypothetical protein C0456_16700 [Hyphomonas sp.]|nr:hypothetical protein [Hyphomonas sp.]
MLLRRLVLSASVLMCPLSGAAMADNAPVPQPAGITKAWQPAPGDVIRFDVLRKGSPFGSHLVTFDEGPDGALVANTKINLKAGLGPITVFRYDHTASEVWREGQLVEVAGEVNDDGKKASMEAVRNGNSLAVQGTLFSGKVPATVIPASHWNYAQTQTRNLLSTEDGEIYDIKVTPKGREKITAAGREIEANRYLLQSDLDVDLWYDDQGRWVKLAFEARGQQIEYVLSQMY